MFPIVAIISLYFIKTLPVRLGVIGGFTLFFALVLDKATTASVKDIFSATAASLSIVTLWGSFAFGDYIAMDPLSIAASVTGVLAFAASTARSLHSLVQEIRDAPEDITVVGRDVQSLVAVLASAQETCTKYDICREDKALAVALGDYLDMWQEDIRADIKDAYEKITNEFRNFETGRRVRRRIEDDVVSASTERSRRASLSEVTDPDFSMRRYLQPEAGQMLMADGINAPVNESYNATETTTFLSPWAGDPNTILKAVRAQNRHLIETLLTQGISLSTRSVQGYTVLHCCAIADDFETADLLIQHGADINAKDYELRSPFRLALASEALNMARLLAEIGCVIGNASATILRLMRRAEEVPGIRILLQALGKRLIDNGQGPFLLHQAIAENEKASIKMLLDESFSVSKPDHRERGADVNQRITRSVMDEVGLPHGWPDTNVPDHLYGATAVYLAARYKRDETMTRFLIQLGADPDAPMWDGMGICAKEFTGAAKVMVEGGSDINRPTHGGRGVMYWTAICENNDLMRTLIAHGGDVNSSHPDDGTLLMLSAARGNLNMIRMLVEAGADVFKLDKNGKTAMQIAGEHGQQDAANALQAVMSRH
ncbi:hypothetical protein ACHAQH_009129 [Verticillium albo-atrum]